MAIAQQDLDAYEVSMQQLYDFLIKSYDAASTVEGKEAIYDLATAVSDILTDLDQKGLAEDAAQLTALQTSVTAVMAQMNKVQAQVNQWIKDIGIAAEVAALMDKAVQLAAKIVGAP
jgi:hypothetical protein